MPRMIPSRPDADCVTSERHVFERLAAALPDSWTVIHARQIVLPATARHPAKTCEIDFLILDPARGLLALEVKGGRVNRESDDLWYSIDGKGDAHQIHNPQKQVTGNVYALREWLREQPPFDQTFLPIGWGLVFPDVSVTASLGSDIPRELIIDQRDLQAAAAAVDRVFAANATASIAPHAEQRTPILDSHKQRQFVDLIAPTTRLVPLLSDQMADEERQLVRLTEEQNNIFSYLGDAARLQVKGSAGSGKTLVAMERTRREAAAGKRVLFLCFNVLLAEWLRNSIAIGGAGALSLITPDALRAPQRGTVTILTFHDLAKKLAKAASLPFEVPNEAAEKQEFWVSKAPQLLASALDALPGARWDSVVVDEGQDFRELWWLAIEKLLAVPSEEVQGASSLWVFYDPHQDIFGADGLRLLNMQHAALPMNCRNTWRIATHAFAEVGETPKLHALAPEGQPVETITCADEAEMRDAVRRTLHRMVSEEKLDPARIVILTTRATDKSLLNGATLGNLKLVDWPAATPNQVGYCSLQRFKGLEADAIILCEVDRTKASASSRHLYVAQSRAKHMLVVAEYGAAQ